MEETENWRQKLWKEQRQMMDECIEACVSITKIELEDENYGQIKEVLKDCLSSLKNHQNGWHQLSVFFERIGEMVKDVEERSDKFDAIMHRTETNASYIEDNETINTIYQTSYESVAFAEMIHGCCSTYTRIADSFLTPTLTRAINMLGYTDSDYNTKLKELDQIATDACDKVSRQWEEFNKKLEGKRTAIQNKVDEEANRIENCSVLDDFDLN